MVICRPEFWSQLKTLYRILEPIHTAQLASEADRATISFVAKRWRNIQVSWSEQQLLLPQVNWDELNATWDSRYRKQTTIENTVAWALDPRFRNENIDIITMNEVLAFLERHAITPLTIEERGQLAV